MGSQICNIKNTYTVSQHNNLIHSKHDLSLAEQKLILILASTVQPGDTELDKKTFQAMKLAELLGVSRQNMYKELPKITESILSKPLYIMGNKHGEYTQLTWLLAAKYEQGEGLVSLQFNPLLKDYLLGMKELFTNFKLNNALMLKSKYALRIYQMIKAHQFRGDFTISLDQFKKELCIDTQKSYDVYSNLKKKTLISSIDEINEKTDVNVAVSEIKKGRKVIAIKFAIRQKKSVENSNSIAINIDEELDSEKELEVAVIKESFNSYGITITNKEAVAVYNKYLETGSNYLECMSHINNSTKNPVGLVISLMGS